MTTANTAARKAEQMQAIKEYIEKMETAALKLQAAQQEYDELEAQGKEILLSVLNEEDRIQQNLNRQLADLQHSRPNLDVYRDIVLDAQRPMHLNEITAEALKRGLDLISTGKNPPRNKVRNGLHSSPRFQNLGNNTWWLAGLPLPDGFTVPQ